MILFRTWANSLPLSELLLESNLFVYSTQQYKTTLKPLPQGPYRKLNNVFMKLAQKSTYLVTIITW